MTTGYYLDFSEFNKKLKKLTKDQIPEYAEKGVFNAMGELLNDSITKPPQAPKDIGDLWGSRIIEKPERTRGAIGVEGGFNIKYAHRHHEAEPGTFKYTTTKGAGQPGPKFMQSKMAQFGKKYIEIVAETIRRKGK